MERLTVLQKLRWRIQKCLKKVSFVDYFVVLVAFFLQNSIYLRKQPHMFAADRIHCFNPRNL